MRALIRQLEEAKKASEVDVQLAKDAGVSIPMYRAARKIADAVKADWDEADRERHQGTAPKNPSENNARFRALASHPTVRDHAKKNAGMAERIGSHKALMKAGKFGEAALNLDEIERGASLTSTRGAGKADEMLLRVKQGELSRTKQRPSWDEVAKKAAQMDAEAKQKNAGDFKTTPEGGAEVPGPDGQVDGAWRTVRGKRVFFPSEPGDDVPEGPWGGAPWRPGWDKQGRFREPKGTRPQRGQMSLFGKHEDMERLFQELEML